MGFQNNLFIFYDHIIFLAIYLCYSLDAKQMNFDSKYCVQYFVNVETVNRILFNFWRVLQNIFLSGFACIPPWKFGPSLLKTVGMCRYF